MNGPTSVDVREALYSVEDPELHMSILELGLIYDVDIFDDGAATVTMTLTSPACPVGPLLQSLVREAAMGVPGIGEVTVDIVFHPPWDPATMASDEVRMELGIW